MCITYISSLLYILRKELIADSGFPLHFETGGTFGLIPYFCTLKV